MTTSRKLEMSMLFHALIRRGDQREQHDSGTSVSIEALKDFGLTYEHIPVDDAGKWEGDIGKLSETPGSLS
jgi:protein tyrosine phosphatase (PTP) superfamily phosphohydrolase (DUF442 family)